MWPGVIEEESQIHSVENKLVPTFTTSSSINNLFPFLKTVNVFQIAVFLIKYFVVNISK
jgi:hypothetical protein